ncbi:MAG: hypothetical protein HY710_11120, partial [Candidatus Latescibacteria bacterium]|nr:hypothetical protein [Candidatus Latescibacterota bacterium]
MTPRERFLAVTRFETPDRLPLPTLFQCFGRETIKRWERDGLPKDAHLAAHFGFDRMELLPIHAGPLPHFEREELEEIEEWRLGLDREFRRKIVNELDAVEEEFPIRSRQDWTTMQRLLNAASPARYPRFWDDYTRCLRERDYPVGVCVNGPLSVLREWLGLCQLTALLVQDWAFIEEMIEYYTEFIILAMTRAVTDVDVDFAVIREEMAYKTASLLNSHTMRTRLIAAYESICELFHDHGVRTIFVESNGQLDGLLDLWVESGMNGAYLLEAGAGVDALNLRRRYGRALVLIGNLDHHAFCKAKRDIADEVRTKVP